MKKFFAFLGRLIVGGIMILGCLLVLAYGETLGVPVCSPLFILAIVGLAAYIVGLKKVTNVVFAVVVCGFVIWFGAAVLIMIYPAEANQMWIKLLDTANAVLFYLGL